VEAVGKSIVVPRLRFPAFRNAEGWTSTTLGLEASFYKGKGISKSEIDPSGSRPCIRYGELYTRYSEVIRDVYSRTNVDQAELFLSQENDVIIPGSGETKEDIATASCVALAGVALGGDLNVIRTPHNGVFLSYYLNGTLRRKIAKIAQGDTVVHLYPSQLEGVSIAFPQSTEQQKIADCLTSLDEVIAAQGQKVEALKTHKRGLMQQLFPREGEALPRLRFPEFRDGPEWEAKRIGDHRPFVTSGSRGWATHYADHGSLFVRITNLSRESILLDLADSRFVNLPPDASEGVRTQLKVHDVLISITADIGIIGYVDAGIPTPAYINQHIALVRFEASAVCAKFVAYLLASDNSQRRFRAATDNGTKAGLNLTEVQNTQLLLPLVQEQQRIASCLASFDDRIAAEYDKLDVMRTHKKGLMQQLFPCPK
jgi:type I restriction enzyme, S subunit